MTSESGLFEAHPMPDPRLDKLAQVLVRYSTRVKPGDLVSIVAPPLAEPLVLALYREVLHAGGHPVVVMAPEACAELLLAHGSTQQLAFVSPLEVREVEAADISIHLLAPQNTRALSQADPRLQAIRGKARRQVMDLFLRRAAEQSLRWVVTQMPCNSSAQDAGMSLAEYEDFVFGAGMLRQADPAAAWQSLSERQVRLAEFL